MIFQKALSKRFFVVNLLKDERFKGSESAVFKGISSALCVPLSLKQENIGVIYVDKRDGSVFEKDDLDFLTAFSELSAIALNNLQVKENLIKENLLLLQEMGRLYGLPQIVGRSESIKRILALLTKISIDTSPK